MSTAQLIEIQAAFSLDEADAMRAESAAFCAGRLALIGDILSARAGR
jgi:hypothetical protein